MIDLYYWPTPNGHKITIFLEEAGLDYRIKPVNIGKGAQFEADYLRISPNNKMPAIVDRAPADGGEAISVFESGAILEYLADKTGRFIPKDVRGRTTTLEWLFWQMGGLGPMTGQYGHFHVYAPESIDYAKDRYAREVDRLLGVLDRRLQEVEYLSGGEYGIADMATYPWIDVYAAARLIAAPTRPSHAGMRRSARARPPSERMRAAMRSIPMQASRCRMKRSGFCLAASPLDPSVNAGARV